MTFGRRTAVSEIGRVSHIYVRQQAFDYGDYDLVEAVDAFVDRMKGWFYRPDELPQEAIYSTAVHEFLCKDCGSQYVRDSRWELDRVAAVRAGLRAMGALDYLEYFQWLSERVDAMKPDIDRLFRTGSSWDRAILDALNHRSRDLRKLRKEKPGDLLVAGYLKSLPNLQPLDDHAFGMKMYELVESVPDYQARLEAALHEGHWLTQMVRILCLKSGQRHHEFCGQRTVLDWEKKIGAFGVMLTRGEHKVIQYASDRAELRDMNGKLVATVDLRETKPEHRPLN